MRAAPCDHEPAGDGTVYEWLDNLAEQLEQMATIEGAPSR